MILTNQKHDHTNKITSHNHTTSQPQTKKKMTSNNNIKYFNHSSPYNNQAQLETIVQWNINSYFKKLTDVHRIITDFQPTALCLQETNLNFNKKNPHPQKLHRILQESHQPRESQWRGMYFRLISIRTWNYPPQYSTRSNCNKNNFKKQSKNQFMQYIRRR